VCQWNWGSPLVHTCWQEWDLWEKGGSGYNDLWACQTYYPSTQVTAQKHNRCPNCLGNFMLQLGTTPKGLTEAGSQSGWLALWCYGWELAHKGGGMDHTVLRGECDNITFFSLSHFIPMPSALSDCSGISAQSLPSICYLLFTPHCVTPLIPIPFLTSSCFL